ncbi:MAG: hypothetical protein R2692_00495 [Microbacterium sp.]
MVRYLFQLLFAPFSRPPAAATYSRHRARVVSTVAGFRGAVSLAIALSVPTSIAGIGELTGRDIVVFVTGGVILLSLLVQGPLLPAITRWARLPADETAADEYELAERTITGAAVAAIDDIAAEHGVSDAVRDRARREGYEMLELSNARAYARQSAADDARIAELETALGQTDAAWMVAAVRRSSTPPGDAPAGIRGGRGPGIRPFAAFVVLSAHDTGRRPAASALRHRSMLAETASTSPSAHTLTRFDETMTETGPDRPKSAPCCNACGARARSTTWSCAGSRPARRAAPARRRSDGLGVTKNCGV